MIPNVLELQTSYNPGALWGFMRDVPHSSLIFAGLSIAAAAGIWAWLFLGRAATDRIVCTRGSNAWRRKGMQCKPSRYRAGSLRAALTPVFQASFTIIGPIGCLRVACPTCLFL